MKALERTIVEIPRILSWLSYKKLKETKVYQKLTQTIWGRLFLLFWFGKTFVFYFLMLRKIGLFSIFTFFLAIPLFSQQNYLEQADIWYGKRDQNRKDLTVGGYAINKAIENYKLAIGQCECEEAYEGLLYSYYFKVNFVVLTDEEKKKITEQARLTGVEGTEKFPGSAPILYWYASILAQWSDSHGIIKANREKVADRIREMAEQVIELSKNYRSSGGYRLLGLVHLHTPKIPFLFDWVSREYSKELLIKAVRRSPEHLGNHFALAKIYDKLGDKEKCDRLLIAIINTPPRKSMLMEDELIREKARRMMGLTDYTLTALKTKNNEK